MLKRINKNCTSGASHGGWRPSDQASQKICRQRNMNNILYELKAHLVWYFFAIPDYITYIYPNVFACTKFF